MSTVTIRQIMIHFPVIFYILMKKLQKKNADTRCICTLFLFKYIYLIELLFIKIIRSNTL